MLLRSVRAALLTGMLLALGASVSAQSQAASAADFNPQTFKAPPAQYRGHAGTGINLTTMTEQSLVKEVDDIAKLNYGGFLLIPGGSTTLGLSEVYLKQFGRGRMSDHGVEFLSTEYFRLYDVAMQEAEKDGIEPVLYDDYNFPSGTAGGCSIPIPPVRRQGT